MQKTKRSAKIVPISVKGSQDFRWEWRSHDGKDKSAASFVYYHDCVEDARQAGFEVELSGTEAKNLDGSSRDKLS
jgi:hypothetical protein